MAECTHLDQIADVDPQTPNGCGECMKVGDRWLHLRLCLTCGEVNCCDSSPNKHATKHFHSSGHPLDPELPAGRGLGLVLRRRDHHGARLVALPVRRVASRRFGTSRPP